MTSPIDFKTYQEYLDNSKSPYICTEKEFQEKKRQREELSLPGRLFNDVFNSFQDALPTKARLGLAYIKIAYWQAGYLIKSNPGTSATILSTASVATAVFFYPEYFGRLMPCAQIYLCAGQFTSLGMSQEFTTNNTTMDFSND